jgi:outer membrane cobalamin receptor
VNARDRAPSTSTEGIDVAWVAAYALARGGVQDGAADIDALVVLAERRRDILEEALAKVDALTDVGHDERHAARTLLRRASASLAEGPSASS